MAYKCSEYVIVIQLNIMQMKLYTVIAQYLTIFLLPVLLAVNNHVQNIIIISYIIISKIIKIIVILKFLQIIYKVNQYAMKLSTSCSEDVIIYSFLSRKESIFLLYATRAQTTCVSRQRCTIHCSSSCVPSFSRDFTRKWEDNFSRILTSASEKWVELVNFKITAKRLLPVTVRYVTAFNWGFMSLCCVYLGRRNCEMNMHFTFAFIHKRSHARSKAHVFTFI